jgi:hypothetical protein
VYALAKEVERNYSNVHTDIDKLEEHALVQRPSSHAARHEEGLGPGALGQPAPPVLALTGPVHRRVYGRKPLRQLVVMWLGGRSVHRACDRRWGGLIRSVASIESRIPGPWPTEIPCRWPPCSNASPHRSWRACRLKNAAPRATRFGRRRRAAQDGGQDDRLLRHVTDDASTRSVLQRSNEVHSHFGKQVHNVFP